jgi:pimeloyl-ACP methyl ester carboxylesterase
LGALGIAAAPVEATGGGCQRGSHIGGEYIICTPDDDAWNGDLLVYAHGYVAPDNPVGIPDEQLKLADGTSITETVTGLGYAFAATSYITNGLAVKDGIAAVKDVVGVFSDTIAAPDHVYLVGASEGGVVTALTTEQHPEIFAGGLATCGPVGDFQRQIDYWGDVRVLFDYFFPDVLPPFEPVEGDPQAPLIPDEVIDSWYWCGDEDRNPNYSCVEEREDAYQTKVREALESDPGKTRQLVRVARVPVKLTEPATAIDALVHLLWYNVFATNDGIAKLGGQPYGNALRWYWGSNNDWRLNRNVTRFHADDEAVEQIEAHYQTSGDLSVPIVTLHTLKDPVVPYWHEPIYRWKVWRNEDWRLHTNIPSLRYGHCSYGAGEALFAFAWLVYQVEGQRLQNVRDVLTSEAYADYGRMSESYGLEPSTDDASIPPSLERELEPVVLTGDQLPLLQGTPTDELFVYAYGDDGFEQIPFQVDEVATDTYQATLGNPLDGDDEVAFMASDLGGRPMEDDQITTTHPISSTWYRVEVTDPLSPTAKGWAYVVRSSGLTQAFTRTYASFDAGTNRITTGEYDLGFLAGHPGFDYLSMHGGDDVLDRTKLRMEPIIGAPLTEEDRTSGPPVPIKDGPVRVIVQNRGTIGYGSIIQTWLRADLFGVVSARLSTDFNEKIAGATFYNGTVPAGVTVDGSPDPAVEETPLSPWWQVSHASGSVVQVADTSGVGGTQSNYYLDDATIDADDTGDQRSYGDSGLKVESPTRYVDYRAAFYVLPESLPNVGQLYAAQAANPLQVTTTVSAPYQTYLPLVLRH